MTHPHQPPRPGPPPGGFRPGPPPGGGFRPGPPPGQQAAPPPRVEVTPGMLDGSESTGHPAVDAVLRSLANAATLAPADQIAEYEAAHQVLQETLASIDR
ncbi:hypothetical protein [Couchioplanes azureus]|uniref:hypothetical protein n=1 Tax=Couchioplanes caeruleus TaxID=56438 RepID=UPI0016710DA1|nr:hypothetical protein [Couchioplanes caeruleus]GGQ86953.1 hypothetical protein GCM10010166_66420 [Couchioplanes caeruleus subsp. azureus]